VSEGKGELGWKINQGRGGVCVVRESVREKWKKKIKIKKQYLNKENDKYTSHVQQWYKTCGAHPM
jgi:hypothetical protein